MISLYAILNGCHTGEFISVPNAEALVSLVSRRCRKDTKDKLSRRVSVPTLIPIVGIFSRVMFDTENGTWGYCAGQSYPDEIRWVREFLLK
jgi:hypothetical protein